MALFGIQTFNYYDKKHHQSSVEKIIAFTVTDMSSIANIDGYWTWKYLWSILQHLSIWLESSHLMLETGWLQWSREDLLQEEKGMKWGKGRRMALPDSTSGLSRFIPVTRHISTPHKVQLGYQHRNGSVHSKLFAFHRHYLQKATKITVFYCRFL